VPETVVGSQLEFSHRSLDSRIRLLVLRGQLDRTTTSALAATLKRASSRRGPGVIVDLTALTALDASGIGLLHDTQLRMAGAGGCLAVVGDELSDAWLLAATRGSTLDVFHSRAEAIAAVNRRILFVRPIAVRSLHEVPVG
jgi:anti-anti-sigma regulatory factor